MKKLFYFLFAITTFSAYAANQTVIDGQAAGAQGMTMSAGDVTQSSADSLTNMSATTSADTTTSQNLQAQFSVSNAGNTGLATQGNAEISKCSSYVPNQSLLSLTPPDPVELAKQQECAAVNELAGLPLQNAINKSGLTKNDSLFQNQNNMYNSANANANLLAGAAVNNMGSGVGGGVTGAGACVTTTATTPAIYTTSSCLRSNAPVTQDCQVLATPSVTSAPYCNIGGGTLAFRAWPNYPWGYYPTAGGTDVWSATSVGWCISDGMGGVSCPVFSGSFIGTIVYSCRAPSDPLYALGGIAQYVQNQYWMTAGGSLNFTRPSLTVNFTIGQTSAVASTPTYNYDGSYLYTTSMYYDGPTDQFYVTTDNSYIVPQPLSCAPGYALVTVYDPNSYYYGGPVELVPSYCSKASDPSSVAFSGLQVAASVSYGQALGSPYASCTDTGYGIVCGWNPGYLGPTGTWTDTGTSLLCQSTTCTISTLMTYTSLVLSASNGQNVGSPYANCSGYGCSWTANYQTTGTWVDYGVYMHCGSTTCTISSVNNCRPGFFLSPSNNICYPNQYDIPLTVVTNDRARRLYAPPNGHYTGSAGTAQTLNDTVNNTCSTLQSQTSNPTATPAVAVNGVYVCPTGMTVSGAYCM